MVALFCTVFFNLGKSTIIIQLFKGLHSLPLSTATPQHRHKHWILLSSFWFFGHCEDPCKPKLKQWHHEMKLTGVNHTCARHREIWSSALWSQACKTVGMITIQFKWCLYEILLILILMLTPYIPFQQYNYFGSFIIKEGRWSMISVTTNDII